MKKSILLALLSAAVISASACSDAQGTAENTTVSAEQQTPGDTSVFTDENGVLTYLDTVNSPFEGAGLKITADKSAKTVRFVKTDLDGNETVEYYLFDFNTNTVEQYYYVSMMGTGFYYTYDISAGEVVKIEDSDRNDTTQSTKDNGRYDSANERLKGDVASIEAYFTAQYGVSVADMVN